MSLDVASVVATKYRVASVRKKASSPFWFACYYREDGTRTQTSTKTRDRKEAQRIADALELAHQRRMTEAQMRRVLSDLSERLSGTPLNSATLREYATQWLQRKRVEVTRVSFDAYRVAVEDFIALTPLKANVGLQYLVPADVAAYRDRIAAKVSARTANNKMKILRTMLQTAWRDGFIPENPAAKVSALKAEESKRRPFTLPELKTLLGVATGEWRGMTLFGLYTGQRLKDIATLRWSNVDLARAEVAFTTSKTKRRQIIPLAKPLLDYLLDIPTASHANAPVFKDACATVEKDGDVGRLSQQFFDLLVSANLATARLPKDEAKGVGRRGPRERSEITFHSLRHTATSLLKIAGASEAVARDIIGHDSAEVSRHYTHVDEGAKRAAIALLPDVLAAS